MFACTLLDGGDMDGIITNTVQEGVRPTVVVVVGMDVEIGVDI
jgi:hypothetical protein